MLTDLLTRPVASLSAAGVVGLPTASLACFVHLVGVSESGHGGAQLRALREAAGLAIEQVAALAGVSAARLAEIERLGTSDLGYGEVAAIVKATQPARPDWWDEGHEHDLGLGPRGVPLPRTAKERDYWRRIELVRAEIEAHYERGRAASA